MPVPPRPRRHVHHLQAQLLHRSLVPSLRIPRRCCGVAAAVLADVPCHSLNGIADGHRHPRSGKRVAVVFVGLVVRRTLHDRHGSAHEHVRLPPHLLQQLQHRRRPAPQHGAQLGAARRHLQQLEHAVVQVAAPRDVRHRVVPQQRAQRLRQGARRNRRVLGVQRHEDAAFAVHRQLAQAVEEAAQQAGHAAVTGGLRLLRLERCGGGATGTPGRAALRAACCCGGAGGVGGGQGGGEVAEKRGEGTAERLQQRQHRVATGLEVAQQGLDVRGLEKVFRPHDAAGGVQERIDGACSQLLVDSLQLGVCCGLRAGRTCLLGRRRERCCCCCCRRRLAFLRRHYFS
eukprot:Rhum_TRINITY_DN15176_c4_g2::Rhum_TRINITY_DN15176_c4_g2_i3::g.142364::m.142364